MNIINFRDRRKRRDIFERLATRYCVEESEFEHIAKCFDYVYLDGIVEERDFGVAAPIFRALLCYKPNQYYIAKDPDSPDNLIFASKKQYLRSKLLCIKEGITIPEAVKKVVKTNASPVRMIAQAVEYNQYAKSIRFFTKLYNKITFDKFCRLLMSKGGWITLKKASIQECYDLELPPSNQGSAKRYAVHSCMYKHKVGKFYDNFNVEGYMAYRNNKPIGRFLVWTMDNGKKYVDRLYCPGEYASQVLSKIDEIFHDAEKYPNEPSSIISCKQEDKLDFKQTAIPYIDTFYRLIFDDDKPEEMKLMNSDRLYEKSFVRRVAHTLRNTSGALKTPFTRCPKCGKLLTSTNNARTLHTILCEKNVKGVRLEKLKKLKEIINKYDKAMEETNNVKVIIQEL